MARNLYDAVSSSQLLRRQIKEKNGRSRKNGSGRVGSKWGIINIVIIKNCLLIDFYGHVIV